MCEAMYIRITQALANMQQMVTTRGLRMPSQSAAPSATNITTANRSMPPNSPGSGHSPTLPGMSVRHIRKYAGSVKLSNRKVESLVSCPSVSMVTR